MQPDPSKIAKTNIVDDPTGGEEFLSTLQNKLLGSADLISSEDTNIEKAISKSIASLKGGNEASAKRITSAFDREIRFEKEGLSSDINTQQEGNRGFAVNIGALRELVKTGDKRIDDLEQRKQELILAGDAATAKEVANLQVQELTLQQEARQRTFTNLLGIGNFGVAKAQESRLAKAQDSAEKQAMASIALKYGINMADGDTFDSIVTKAMPFASQEQQLGIARMKAEIGRINAETQKALRGEGRNISDTNTLKSLASTYLSLDPNSEEAKRVLSSVSDDSLDEFFDYMKQSNEAKVEAAKAEMKGEATAGTNLPSIWKGFGDQFVKGTFKFAEFMTGQEAD